MPAETNQDFERGFQAGLAVNSSKELMAAVGGREIGRVFPVTIAHLVPEGHSSKIELIEGVEYYRSNRVDVVEFDPKRSVIDQWQRLPTKTGNWSSTLSVIKMHSAWLEKTTAHQTMAANVRAFYAQPGRVESAVIPSQADAALANRSQMYNIQATPSLLPSLFASVPPLLASSLTVPDVSAGCRVRVRRSPVGWPAPGGLCAALSRVR